MDITYEPGVILISVQKEGEPLSQVEREAMMVQRDGLPTGLAYLKSTDEVYSITHVPSGVDLCSWWRVETEEEVRRWIEPLLDLADWSEKMPRAVASSLKLLRYAVVGLLYELAMEDEA